MLLHRLPTCCQQHALPCCPRPSLSPVACGGSISQVQDACGLQLCAIISMQNNFDGHLIQISNDWQIPCKAIKPNEQLFKVIDYLLRMEFNVYLIIMMLFLQFCLDIRIAFVNASTAYCELHCDGTLGIGSCITYKALCNVKADRLVVFRLKTPYPLGYLCSKLVGNTDISILNTKTLLSLS